MIHSVIISPRERHPADLALKERLENAKHLVKIISHVGELEKNRADLVINRSFGMDYDDSDLDYLQKLISTGSGIQTLNSIESQRVCRDKMLTLETAKRLGLATGKFYRINSFLEKRRKGRWTLKTLRGMQGRGVFPNLSYDEIALRFDRQQDKRYIVQEHLSGEEIRAMKLGRKILWLSKKQSGNLHTGGSFHITEAHDVLNKHALRLFNEVGLRFGAADFIFNGEQAFILDCNAYPGLKAMSHWPEHIHRFFKDLTVS